MYVSPYLHGKFSLLFLPDYLVKSLEELEITSTDIIDAIKEHSVKVLVENYNDDKDSRLNSILEKLYKYIGKGDLKDLIKFNEVLLGYLHLDRYENNFQTLFSVISQENSVNEENSFTCLNTFKFEHMNGSNFADTFELKNDNGIITIILKNGFTNYITGSYSKNVKKELLSKIIENINDDKIVNTSIGVSFLKLSML